MGYQYEGPSRSFAAAAAPANAVPFIHRLAASGAFKDLFREGMALVEEAASYLDGPGDGMAQPSARCRARVLH